MSFLFLLLLSKASKFYFLLLIEFRLKTVGFEQIYLCFSRVSGFSWFIYKETKESKINNQTKGSRRFISFFSLNKNKV